MANYIKFDSGDENPLTQLGVVSKVKESHFRYPCPSSSCQESFCNYECYRLAKNLYHDELC
ncbi:15772_t:CDS:2, partial [Funneliformis geosporum]